MPVRFRSVTRLIPVACALALAGCSTGVDDDRWATGSSTVVASADYAVVHSVDTEGGTIASFEVSTGVTTQVEVGSEPVRVARLGDRILATLKGDREFVVLAEGDDGLTIVDRVGTAAEPYGIVTSEDGTRIFVAAASAGLVQEFDGETLEFLRDWQVPDEPRWLALHPSGEALFVASAFGGTVSRIDLSADSVSQIELPNVTAPELSNFTEIDLTQRVTGDPAVAPDGRSIAIPVLYVDNKTPVGVPTPDGFPAPSGYGGGGEGDFESNVPGSGPGRFTPGVVTIVLDGAGLVVPDETSTVNVATHDGDLSVVRSYVSSLTFSPDGDDLFATMEASGIVVALPSKPNRAVEAPAALGNMNRGMDGGAEIAFNVGISLEARPTTPILTDAGPRGVVFLSDDDAFVHNFIARSLTSLDASTLDIDRNDPVGATAAIDLSEGIAAYPSTLSPELDEGRELFFSANDRQMSAEGSGVSCSTCHLDGRNDGLTWPLAVGERQTPSLAGVISATAPVTWTSDVPSVAHEVVATSEGQMGGSGLDDDQRDAVAAFIDYTPAPDSPRRAIDDEAVARGSEIFNREEVGCGSCHSGEAFTDNEEYTMYGLRDVRTRTLVGISSSAPYLHDGSIADLGALLERVRDGSMGDTSSLSAPEMADLRAYLESL